MYLVRHKLNYSLSILIVLLLMLFFGFIAVGFALPQLFDQVSLLQAKLPQIILQLERFLTVYSGELSSLIGVDLDKADLIISVSGFEPAISEPVSTDRLRSSWRYG